MINEMKSKKPIIFFKKKYYNKITCLTAYSSTIAKILDGEIDVILIGDSLGSQVYGYDNTRSVTLEMMKNHGMAVTKFVKKSTTMIDLPYKTYENKKDALKNSKYLIKHTGVNLVKIEINEKKLPIINYLSNKKINIVAHIGVTPQSYKNFKNIKVLGKTKDEINKLNQLAINAEKAGAKAILLECVTKETAKEIYSSLSIPIIGIGASKFCHGQVLVFDDLINIEDNKKKPKFVKNYMNFFKDSKFAIQKFKREVQSQKFPGKKNTYK